MSRPAVDETVMTATEREEKIAALREKLKSLSESAGIYQVPVAKDMQEEAAALGFEIREGSLFQKWDETTYSINDRPQPEQLTQFFSTKVQAQISALQNRLFPSDGVYAVPVSEEEQKKIKDELSKFGIAVEGGRLTFKADNGMVYDIPDQDNQAPVVVASDPALYAQVDYTMVGQSKGTVTTDSPPKAPDLGTLSRVAAKNREALTASTFVNPSLLPTDKDGYVVLTGGEPTAPSLQASNEPLYDLGSEGIYSETRLDPASSPASRATTASKAPPLPSRPATSGRPKMKIPGADNAAIDEETGELDLGGVTTKAGVDRAKKIGDGIEAKSKQDPELAKKYNLIIDIANNHALRGDPEDAANQIDVVADKDGNDVALRFFASAMSAIFNSPAGTSDEDKDAAFSEVVASFHFLEQGGHDAEWHQVNSLRAMDAITGETSGIKNAGLKEHINKAVKNHIAERYGDLDLTKSQQEDELEQDDETVDASSQAKPKKKEKDPAEEKEEKSKGLSFKSAAIGVFKAGAAIGLSVGAPPIGWALAIGFLYATRGWGNVKPKESGLGDEEAEELQYLRGRDQMRAAEKFRPKTKDSLSLDLDESTPASGSAPAQSNAPAPNPSGQAPSAAPVPSIQAPTPSRTNLGVVVSNVASQASSELGARVSIMAGQLDALQNQSIMAPELEVSSPVVAPQNSVVAPENSSPAVSAPSEQVYATLGSDRTIYESVSMSVVEQDYADLASGHAKYDSVSAPVAEKEEVEVEAIYEMASAGDGSQLVAVDEEDHGIDLNHDGLTEAEREAKKVAKILSSIDGMDGEELKDGQVDPVANQEVADKVTVGGGRGDK
jgi:hypothetical protein